MLDQVCPMQYLAKWKKFGSEYSTSVLRYHRADDSFHTCPHCPTSLYARSQKHGGSFFTAAAASVSEIQVDPSVLDAYQGYSAMNIQTWHDGLAAVLVLSPNRCNIFEDDIPSSAIYEAGMFDRLISVFKTET